MAVGQGDWSNPERTPEQRDRLRASLQQRVKDFNKEHPGPAPKNFFDQLSEKLTRDFNKAFEKAAREKTGNDQEPSRDELEAAAARGETLEWDGDSECFASIEYSDGVVDVVFNSGHSYSAEMDLDTAIDFLGADSVGEFFNEELGRDYFAPTKQTKGD